jgi:selenocysteine lyase/cysteine desulfurase
VQTGSLRRLTLLIPGPTHQAQGPHDRAHRSVCTAPAWRITARAHRLYRCGLLSCSSVSADSLRSQFPVLERIAYLNAGTDGPLPEAAVRAGSEEIHAQARRGRAGEHFERRHELAEQLRAAYARALGARSEDVALTTCTSEGLSSVIDGLELVEGEEILTSEEEHPGLLGALSAVRQLRGVSVRVVPFMDIADAVGSRTRLVTCSHVSWMTGRIAPAGLAELDVPVVLDGAQGVGAIPVDVRALGCDAYAGAGQKWLCGPDGLGMLYVAPSFRERLQVRRRGYGNLADPGAGLDASLHHDARRFDTFALSAEALASAFAALDTLERAGWATVHEHAIALTRRLAELLGGAGRAVAPRGDSTLVSFASANPPAERARLAEQGVVLRDIPNHPQLRASVGAWNDESDLQRLLAALEN